MNLCMCNILVAQYICFKIIITLYDTVGIYHSGGIVGGMKLKSNEEFAKLMKGEVVVNSDQIENFMKGANSSINQGGIGEIQQNFEFNIEGGVDKDSLLPILKKFGATIKMETIEAINKANRNRGLKPRIG